MTYPSIYISGNLISQELIDKLDDDSSLGQRPSDFGLESGTRVRQDIARAWTDANEYWKIFKRKLDALKESERGTTETRSQWIIPMLGLLGYELNYVQQPETINEKSYDISHRVSNRDALPVMIVSAKDELDKKPEGNSRYRMSPHALLQEYLNVTEHTYGLVTNGKLIRLLRDNGRISRLTYLEFNLEKIFEEDLYGDFALLYRLLHISRMPITQGQVTDSIIEKYYQQAIEAGTRIRSSLSNAVEQAIKILANGLLRHPDNEELRMHLQAVKMSSLDFYQMQLRLVYRLLFIMTIEERRLVYPELTDSQLQKQSDIYYRFYSLQNLRNLAGKRHLVQGKHHQLYIQLWHNFRLLEEERFAAKLGLHALGSGIFEPGILEPLDDCKMFNKDLLEALYHLSYFTDEESGQEIRVNYGALNVEEFGSVYEGLLEYEAKVEDVGGQWQFTFIKSKERSKSGSHYTPEELVQPLIKHSLEYLIEDRLKEKDPVQALLRLKVCDVACGSGHILLSAARRIALEVARKQFIEEQPSPTNLRWATRQVISHCIYGVDKNPLAIELCKVAMWLEAHNPGEPLNFLDHHIKCGDAIVGLAHRSELENGITDEAFKTLPGDDKVIAKTWRDKNIKERKERTAKAFQLKAEFEKSTENCVQEAMAEYKTFNQLPETTPDEIERKAKAYKKFIDGKGFTFLKAMADTQVAQFFIPKTEANKDYLMTDADFRLILSGYKGWQDRKVAKATVVALEQRFFHWFIEFPEVFDEGGFDCVLGNPPYLGGRKISTAYGDYYLNTIKALYQPTEALTDFVVYFLKRDYLIIKLKGFVSLITTSSIYEGDSRSTGLQVLLEKEASIIYGYRSLKWPGVANLNVCLLALTKQLWSSQYFLDGKLVDFIDSFLKPNKQVQHPYDLMENKGKAGLGYYVLGDGFLLTHEERDKIIQKDNKYIDVLFPYINGDDINNDYLCKPSRQVIYFSDWPLSKASQYDEVFKIVEQKVKPERLKKKSKDYRDKWWLFARRAKEISINIKTLNRFFIAPRTTKYILMVEGESNTLFSDATVGFARESWAEFAILQSEFFDAWVRQYSSSLGNTIRMTPSDSSENFPFPKKYTPDFNLIGETYYAERKTLNHRLLLGLTDLYNLFHSNAITAQSINDKDKQVVSLQKHLEKTANTISFDEAIQCILKLRELHLKMDEAVLEAYGWNDIGLKHDFYEVDYLPENDRIRYTIHPDARKEVLKRLLELNHKIHEEELRAGLWDKKQGKGKNRGDDNAGEEDSALGGLFGV